MVAQTDATAFQSARKALSSRLDELVTKESYAPAILLADRAVENLPERLTVEERQGFQTTLASARAAQRISDSKKVSQLVGQLNGADEAVRVKTSGELQALADRAVYPLLEMLKSNLEADPSDPKVTASIIIVLKQIAPKLTGYDPEASRDQQIEVIEGWLKARK